VRSGAEGEQPGVTGRGDVETLAVPLPVGTGLAVCPLGAHGHDRARGEDDIPVLDLLQADPRRERRDRLEPEHLVDGARDQARVPREQLPLPGMLGEQPHGVRELGGGGVDPSGEQVHHQLHALPGGERVSLFLDGEQLADQVVAGSGAPGLEQLPHVVLHLGDGTLDILAAGFQRPDVELPLDPAGPGMQPPRVRMRRAEHGRDRQRRVGPGQRGHEVAGALGGDPPPQR
jgi:hypothetical protein